MKKSRVRSISTAHYICCALHKRCWWLVDRHPDDLAQPFRKKTLAAAASARLPPSQCFMIMMTIIYININIQHIFFFSGGKWSETTKENTAQTHADDEWTAEEERVQVAENRAWRPAISRLGAQLSVRKRRVLRWCWTFSLSLMMWSH